MDTESDPADSNPFDVQRVRELVELMSVNDLSEIDLQFDNARVRLRRGGKPSVITTVAAPVPLPLPAAPATVVPAAPTETALPKPLDNTKTIKSPIVGTFYTASSPDSPPFVNVGSKVNDKTVVCIIEAMKVFNEIPAGMTGTIAEILVENGQPIEYNQPLFRVTP